MNTNTIERFWSKVDKAGDCWLWTASKRHKGYGAFVWADKNGRVVQGRAHRFAWIVTNGDIPDGLCALHVCDNPACVRPDHLFLGTKGDNNRDMIKKGRHRRGGTKTPVTKCKYPRGERHPGAKLTVDDVRAIRKLRSEGNSLSKIAKLHGVNITSVYNITNRKTWKHVE